MKRRAKSKTAAGKGRTAWMLGAAIPFMLLAIDGITRSLGFVDLIANRFFPPEPKYVVRVVKNGKWESECLEIAFFDLPKGFAIGRFTLLPVKVDGPSPIGVNQTAEIKEMSVNYEISNADLLLQRPLDVNLRQVADENGDRFIVDFCPILKMAGYESKLSAKLEFFGGDNEPVFHASTNVLYEILVQSPPAAELVHKPLGRE